MWDVRTGRCEVKLESEGAEVNAVKFMAGGEMLAVAGSDGAVSDSSLDMGWKSV